MIKKTELLMPAGGYDAFLQAMYHGADAVYLGLKQFSARASSINFSNEEFIQAIHLAHIANMKIYVTMNTLLDEDEIQEAINCMDFLYTHQVDGIIIQDLGLLEIMHTRYPNLEIHISTQMFIHNVEGIKFLKNYGVSRIVIARETPIEIINEMSSLDIDIEVFVYGALCTSYSGQCLMSSVLKERSANKGRCAQLCRLPYQLIQNQKTLATQDYLLSLKDLNLIDQLDKLLDLNLSSFKIEGRMKRSEYVGYITKIFRKRIDYYYQGKHYQLSEQERIGLKTLFNRGFTTGYVFKDLHVHNHFRPNHLGIDLGIVQSVTKKQIAILLSHDLHQHDGIRILNEKEDVGLTANKIYLNGLLVNHAKKGEVVYLDVSQYVQINDRVVLTSDSKQLEALQNETLDYDVKRCIHLEIYLEIGNTPFIKIVDKQQVYYLKGDEKVQAAIKNPLDEQRIIQQLSKIGIQPYYFDIRVDMHQAIFMSMNQLNQCKRAIIEMINMVHHHVYIGRNIQPQLNPLTPVSQTELTIVEIANEAQRSLTKADIYVSFNPGMKKVEYLPRLINEQGEYTSSRFVHSINDLTNYDNKSLISTHYMNITNSYALAFLYRNGVDLAFLSCELNDQQIDKLLAGFKQRYGFEANVGLLTYGRRNLMNMKYCPIQAHYQSERDCKLCEHHQFELKMNKQKFPLVSDHHCHLIILEDEAYQRSSQHPKIKNQYIRYTVE